MSLYLEKNYDDIKSVADEAIVEVIQNYDFNNTKDDAEYTVVETYENELIMRYEKLIKSIVYKFNDSLNSSEYEELFQIGMIALNHAAKNYKLGSNAKFGTYAYKVIESKIHDNVVYENKPITIPQNKIKLNKKIKSERAKFINKYNAEPSTFELSEILGVSVETIEDIERYCSYSVENYDNKIDSESDTSYIDLLADQTQVDPETNLINEFTIEIVDKGIKALSDDEQTVLLYRNGFNGEIKTLSELSEMLDCSISKVLAIEKSGLEKMRSYLSENGIN